MKLGVNLCCGLWQSYNGMAKLRWLVIAALNSSHRKLVILSNDAVSMHLVHGLNHWLSIMSLETKYELHTF